LINGHEESESNSKWIQRRLSHSKTKRLTNASAKRAIGWGAVAVIIAFFNISYFMGGRIQMFFATYLFSHLPLFMVVFWAVFAPNTLTSRSFKRAVFCGWPAFLLSGILWEISYRRLYRKFGWGVPDLPGEVLAGVLFGWFPALFVAALAGFARSIMDFVLPPERL
jgi:hypothetical protein